MNMVHTKQGAEFHMTEDEYRALVEGSTGLCLACGAERDGTEPDACEYECDACCEHAVYGAESLIIDERIKITG